jgi:thiol-disulfide isomerase/thioredoxin
MIFYYKSSASYRELHDSFQVRKYRFQVFIYILRELRMSLLDKLKALFLCSLLMFSLSLMAGCENIGGLGKAKRMEIGKPAPDFTLQDASGKVWQLSSLKGKVVFVNFWATWCKPCRDEMPSMEALNKAMSDRPFQMLSIAFNDDHDLAESFARRLGATFPVLGNPDKDLT